MCTAMASINSNDKNLFDFKRKTNSLANSFSQLKTGKLKKIIRKFQPHFLEKLRKLRLKQKSDFLIKKNV